MYDDEPSISLGLAKLLITIKYFVSRNGKEMYSDIHVRERIVSIGKDIYIDIPVTKSVDKVLNGPLESVFVGVSIESVVDACGSVLTPKEQIFNLNVDWNKTATNSCQSCEINP